jgi:hypothetical protein
VFRIVEGEKIISEETEQLKMSYYTYPQCVTLFKLAGLEIVKQYGSFNKGPLDNDADAMIFLLKKIR